VEALPVRPHLVMITAFGTIDNAIKAMKLGAFDYLTKPFDIEELLLTVKRALDDRDLRNEVARLRREVEERYCFDNIIGRSPAMQEIFELIRRVADAPVSVIITGESGTGKELVSRSLHHNSRRARGPFVAVNCAAIPENLLESELFGSKRGAYTDAHRDRTGLLVNANGGTVFLDEVGELPPQVQAKLLRVLQEREVKPLGSVHTVPIDVRFISATNRDLDEMRSTGAFREDLYYRLNVVQIHIPPLRERPEDILPLASHLLARAAQRAGQQVKEIGTDVARALLSHHWPGNVRELENVLERAVALSRSDRVEPGDLPPALRESPTPNAVDAASQAGLTLAELEQGYILRVLQDEGGNKTRAAQRLGLDRKTLYRKLDSIRRKGQ